MRATGRVLSWQVLGLGLFLFIPFVLFLFVRHPEPVAASLAGGIALMVGHRVLARPYMEAVRNRKCLWCNGTPRPRSEPLRLLTGDGELVATVCPQHFEPAARFAAFLDRARVPLRAGIFLPLLALLAALAAAALGERRWLEPAVAVFQLLVGVTVNFAAFGYLTERATTPAQLPFPAHNLFLIGERNLVWVFRLVGIWWIWRGLAGVSRTL